MDGLKIFYSKNKINSLILLFLSFITIFIQYTISENIKIFFDQGILKENVNIITNTFLMLSLILIINFLIELVSFYFENIIFNTGLLSLRKAMLEKVYKTKYTYFTNNQSNQIWTDINLTSLKLYTFYETFISIFVSVIQLAIYSFIIFKINAIACILTFSAFPIIVLMTVFIGGKLEKYQKNAFSNYKNISNNTIESFDLIKTMKMDNKYDYFLKNFENEHVVFNRNNNIYGFLHSYWNFFITFISSIFPLLAIFILFKNSNIVNMSTGNMMVLYSFIPLLLNSFRGIYSQFMNFFGNKPFIDKFNEYLKLESENDENTEIGIMPKKFNIKLKNVTYKYGEIEKKIPDMFINEGEKIMLVGESGIGKSTLFNIICGFLDNYSGEIKIDETDISKLNLRYLRNNIGIAFQDSKIINNSLKENIIFDDFLSEENYKKILNIVSLDKISHENNSKLNNNILSGGEKARIQLARVIKKKPKILLLDETFSSMAEEMEKEIIKKIFKEFNDSTIIMISHRKSSSAHFDKVVEFV